MKLLGTILWAIYAIVVGALLTVFIALPCALIALVSKPFTTKRHTIEVTRSARPF